MRKQSGITMGEILFVAGMAILACAILMYVWLHTGTASRHRVCASNVRQLGTAMVMYAMDHDDTFPTYGNIEKLPTTGAAPKVAPQPALLRACLRLYTDDANWFCPADPVQERNTIYLGIDHQAASYSIAAIRAEQGNAARLPRVH